MFQRILITGHSGFVGPHVVAELRDRFREATLAGAARLSEGEPTGPNAPDLQMRLDITDRSDVRAVINGFRPDAVVHLAAQKTASLDELLTIHAVGTEHLLDCLEAAAPDARTVVVGSSAELGRIHGPDSPIGEGATCNPVDRYGISKLAQSHVAGQRAMHGQQVVRIRPFNLLGPAMPEWLLPGRCARLLAAVQDDAGAELQFGTLEQRRDYLDVRDVASAIALALIKGKPGALYHIGSGRSRSGHDLVRALIRKSALRNVTYRSAPPAQALLVPWQTADSRLASRELGWRIQISWKQSLDSLWRSVKRPTPEAVV